jgi:hypothetical protein
MSDKSAQEIFDEFWKPLVTDGNGCFIPEAVKNELADYYFIMDQVPKVYSHVTGGNLSYPNYYADSVIEEADRYVDNTVQFYIQDLYETIQDCSSLDEALEIIRNMYEVE